MYGKTLRCFFISDFFLMILGLLFAKEGKKNTTTLMMTSLVWLVKTGLGQKPGG